MERLSLAVAVDWSVIVVQAVQHVSYHAPSGRRVASHCVKSLSTRVRPGPREVTVSRATFLGFWRREKLTCPQGDLATQVDANVSSHHAHRLTAAAVVATNATDGFLDLTGACLWRIRTVRQRHI